MLTRSRTKAARVEAATTDASLADQPPEILNLIGDALAADEDALQPRHLGALSRSCKVVKAAVKDSLAKVKVEYEAARALLGKCGYSVEEIMTARPANLVWSNKRLTAADVPAMISVLKSKALARLEVLNLFRNNLGDEGVATFVVGAAGCGLPRLKTLELGANQIGVAGMQGLATAFADGAFRELAVLALSGNEIGDAGLTALAAALEKGALPKLERLWLNHNGIGDEGVKALMAAAGGGRLAKLELLYVTGNEYGEEGVDALALAIDNGQLPSLNSLFVDQTPASQRLTAACERHGVPTIIVVARM